MAFGKKAPTEVVRVEIKPPNFRINSIPIIGTAPYVTNKMTDGSRAAMRAGMTGENKKDKTSKRGRPDKDFQADFQGSQHRDVEKSWVGIPAPAFRSAMVRACGLANVVMTEGKQCFFVEADGIDSDGIPLVRIAKGKPEYFEALVKNSNGSSDLRARAKFATGWEATLRVKFDADIFSEQTVANLVERAGITVGVGAGRPFSSKSSGCGWGTFEIKKSKESAA